MEQFHTALAKLQDIRWVKAANQKALAVRQGVGLFRVLYNSRFPSSPLITRVPFFLVFGLNKESQKIKGKRVLLGNLENTTHMKKPTPQLMSLALPGRSLLLLLGVFGVQGLGFRV